MKLFNILSQIKLNFKKLADRFGGFRGTENVTFFVVLDTGVLLWMSHAHFSALHFLR